MGRDLNADILICCTNTIVHDDYQVIMEYPVFDEIRIEETEGNVEIAKADCVDKVINIVKEVVK